MMNEAHISLSGYVATQPHYRETRTGVPSLTMRVAWTPRRLDRATGEWTDARTSFLSVNLYRKMAENAATCLRKGDPVVVHGRFTVREFEDKNGLQRTSVEVDATSLGHDLARGLSSFQRVRPQAGMTAMELRTSESGLASVEGAMLAAEAGLRTGDRVGGGSGLLDGLAGGPGQADGAEEAQGDEEALDVAADGESFGDEAADARVAEPAGLAAPF